MNTTTVSIALTLALFSWGISGEPSDGTNDFYDNEKTYDLTSDTVRVDGEVANPGVVDFSALPLRSVIAKEAVLHNGKDVFVGAYRFDGYSLYDILNARQFRKKNGKEFSGCIDLFVTVENRKGLTAVFSWGEIYYPVNRHKIIIATKVMRIVPSKTKELWPLPETSKVVAATDLLTERNITDPVKITICSFPRSYKGLKGLKPLIADTMRIVDSAAVVAGVTALPAGCRQMEYKNVFYGRGTGIHGITTFKGALLRDILITYFPLTVSDLRSGILCFAAPDGYRCAFSYSEIVNRNDQSEVLLAELDKGVDGGRFKLFAAPDFFSDRAIKAICEITHLNLSRRNSGP